MAYTRKPVRIDAEGFDPAQLAAEIEREQAALLKAREGKPLPNNVECMPIKATWKITEKNVLTGEITSHEAENTIMNLGRVEILKLMFNLSGSPFVAMGVGASAHPTDPEDPDQTRLQYELIGNATRKTLLDSTGGALGSGDIETAVVDIGDNNAHTEDITVYRRLVMTSVYATDDLNNGNYFVEYGLFTTATLPGTPTSTSGIMFNRFEDEFPIFKDSSKEITAECTVHL